CEPGSGGWVPAVTSGSLASAAQAGGLSGARKKRIARTGNSATRRATEKGRCWKGAFIVETISGRLLHFTRANLPQGSGAAQPHVTAGIPVLQLFESANHAFHRLSLFRTVCLHCRRGVGRHLFRFAVLQRSDKNIDGFHAHARIGVMLQRIEQGLSYVIVRSR